MVPSKEGSKTNTIMVVGDKVTYFEHENNELFSTSVGEWLKDHFPKYVGFDMDKVYQTKIVRDYVPHTLSKEVLEEYFEEFKKEVKRIKPKFIITFGKLPMKLMFRSTAITKHRGKEYTFMGAQVISTFNPTYVMKLPSWYEPFIIDLTHFKNLIRNPLHNLPKDFNWVLVDTMGKAECMLADLKYFKSGTIAYDIESTGLKVDEEELLMIGVGNKNQTYVIPVNMLDYFSITYKDLEYILYELGRILTERHSTAHNADFDDWWLYNHGVETDVSFDTMLASYILDPEGKHGLKYLTKKYFGALDYDKGVEFKKDLAIHEFIDMAKYCALDVYYTGKLYEELKKELKENPRLMRVFKYILMPGLKTLGNVRKRGIYVNRDKAKEVINAYKIKLEDINKAMKTYLPPGMEDINLNSPKQLRKLLYDHLGLSTTNKTGTGKKSTNKSTLIDLASKHEVPELILSYRKYDKAINTFLEPWLETYSSEEDPRLHTKYNIARTATGRLSAQDPNLQQVPREKDIRSVVTAPEGKDLIEIDYSQIELRAAAFVADADSMKIAYREGIDIHTLTASQVTGIPFEDISYKERTGAKAVNFGYLYGMWWKSFKQYAYDTYGVVVTDEEAKQSRDRYFKAYPELLPWHERQRSYVNKYGEILSPLGRVRKLPDIYSTEKYIVASTERKAINTPVQSFASDMTLLSMILIDKKVKDYPDTYVVGQIHDAIMIEVPEEYTQEVAKVCKHIMENTIPKVLSKYFDINLDLPLVADAEISKGILEGWGTGKELEI